MSDIDRLLPPSATTSERAIEAVIAERTIGIETPIATLWNADTCPEELLPWMAWAFSVEVWDHAWSETVKRNVIRNSIQVHRMKGTRRSVELALEALGFQIDIVEGWQDGGAPHTFCLDAYGHEIFQAGYQIDASLFETVSRLINNVKPVRSRFTFRIGEHVRAPGRLRVGVRDRHRERGTLLPKPRIRAAKPETFARLGVRDTHRERGGLTPKPRNNVATIGAVTRLGLRDRAVLSAEFTITPRFGAAYAR